MPMQTFNRTDFPIEVLATLPVLGETVSAWRSRRITLYAHPFDADRLISIGRTFDGIMVVIADESREAWATALDYIAHGNVYVSQ